MWAAAHICLSLPYTDYPVLYLYIMKLGQEASWWTILHMLVWAVTGCEGACEGVGMRG